MSHSEHAPELKELREKGEKLEKELLKKAGGNLSASEVTKILDITELQLHAKRITNSLIVFVTNSKGEVTYSYPACQFDGNKIVPGLSEALHSMPIQDQWMRLEWLITEDDALNSLSPLEALKAGHIEDVHQIARGQGA